MNNFSDEVMEDMEIQPLESVNAVEGAPGVVTDDNEPPQKPEQAFDDAKIQNTMTYAVSRPELNWHPDRHQLYDELHTRPFPVINTPVKVSHIASLNTDGRAKAFEHLIDLCRRYGVNPPAEGATCYYQSFDAFDIRWESHSEFCTYTVIRSADNQVQFEHSALSLLPSDWVNSIPGQIVAAVHVEMQDAPETQPTREELHQYFEGHRLIACVVGTNSAQLWTAFRPHSDGFGRILAYNQELNACQAGRLLRRLLELETYRSMALLGLPMARAVAADLTDMEQQIAEITQEISDIQSLSDEKRLLSRMSKLSAKSEQLISNYSYRFSATKAYYELVMSRLEELRETEVMGLLTMTEFLSRRVTPAFRTCEAVKSRLDGVSTRLDRASELLRTRIDMVIEQQNQYLLKSMDRRSKLQLYMQQTVEGLSIAAITYYLLSLVDLALGSSHWVSVELDHQAIIGVSVPFVLILVWISQKRLKKKIVNVNKEMKEKQRVTDIQSLDDK